jgi:hypothetical protein
VLRRNSTVILGNLRVDADHDLPTSRGRAELSGRAAPKPELLASAWLNFDLTE